MNIQKTLLLTGLLVVSGGAFAAKTAELSVSGTIKPGSCDVIINGGAAVALGDIPVSQLNSDPAQPTVLPTVTAAFTINCTGPMVVGTSWVDNKLADGVSAPGDGHFSLGKDSANAPIGHLSIQHGAGNSVAVTGGVGGAANTRVMSTSDSGTTWIDTTAGGASKTLTNGYVLATDAAPIAHETYSGSFNLLPVIAPKNSLSLSSDLDISASATVQVKYL